MALVVAMVPVGAAQPRAQQGGSVGDDVIQETVSNSNGPEAGVWVIAETTEMEDLPAFQSLTCRASPAA